jgi:hypothetical protein
MVESTVLSTPVPAGSYTIVATLVGFQRENKQVQLADAPIGPLEFALRPGILTEVLWTVAEPREAHGARTPSRTCGSTARVRPHPVDADVVSAWHGVGVVAVWKGVLPGVCFDGSVPVEGIEKPYQPGEEYVIFLVGAGERFGRLVGPHSGPRWNSCHAESF